MNFYRKHSSERFHQDFIVSKAQKFRETYWAKTYFDKENIKKRRIQSIKNLLNRIEKRDKTSKIERNIKYFFLKRCVELSDQLEIVKNLVISVTRIAH